MKILIYVFLITTLLISCEIVEPLYPEDYFKNGNTAPERTYYPTTFGTWWKYQLNSDSTAPYMLSTVGAEVQIDGIYYAEIVNKVDTIEFKQYLRFNNSDVYLLQQVDSSALKSKYEFLLLKADAKIGQKWSTVTTFSDNSIFRYDGEMINRDYTLKVRDKEFQNVIKIKMIISINLDGNLVPIIENYYYFAKKIGIIRVEPTDVGSSDLVDYEIR